MPNQLKGQISYDNVWCGPLAKICLAVWTTGHREKVGGLEGLQDHDEGPLAFYPLFLCEIKYEVHHLLIANLIKRWLELVGLIKNLSLAYPFHLLDSNVGFSSQSNRVCVHHDTCQLYWW